MGQIPNDSRPMAPIVPRWNTKMSQDDTAGRAADHL